VVTAVSGGRPSLHGRCPFASIVTLQGGVHLMYVAYGAGPCAVHPSSEGTIASQATHLSSGIGRGPDQPVSPIEATEASGGAHGALHSSSAPTCFLDTAGDRILWAATEFAEGVRWSLVRLKLPGLQVRIATASGQLAQHQLCGVS
jgi:hypothetical protein